MGLDIGGLMTGASFLNAFMTQGQSAPKFKSGVAMDATDKAFYKNWTDTVKKQHDTGLMPQNLASMYIAQATRPVQQSMRDADTAMLAAGAAPVQSGSMGKGLMASGQGMASGLAQSRLMPFNMRKQELASSHENLGAILSQARKQQGIDAQINTLNKNMNDTWKAYQGQQWGNAIGAMGGMFTTGGF